MTASLADSEPKLNHEAIQSALAAWREGRSTGDATLDRVASALSRFHAYSWARARRARPDIPEAAIDLAAAKAVDSLASAPMQVVLLVLVDAARRAAAGGVS